MRRRRLAKEALLLLHLLLRLLPKRRLLRAVGGLSKGIVCGRGRCGTKQVLILTPGDSPRGRRGLRQLLLLRRRRLLEGIVATDTRQTCAAATPKEPPAK